MVWSYPVFVNGVGEKARRRTPNVRNSSAISKGVSAAHG